MAELLTLMEGTEVECTDGRQARLDRTLVDSTTKQVKHIAVGAPGGESGRLVPSSHLQYWNDHLGLDCSSVELQSFDLAVVPRIVPDTMAAATGGMSERTVFVHNVPDGEVEVVTGEEVRAEDGRVGRLVAMTVDARDNSIQQLVVRVGHLFSKKDLAVPAPFVASFDRDTVLLAGSKRQLMSSLAA